MRRNDTIYNKVYVAAACIMLCLAAFFLPERIREKGEAQRIAELEAELEEARKKAEEASLVKSVSRQMEEIAYQQKELSDMQRRAAEQQAEENYRMKLRVEQEWKRAVAAQEEAERAYRMADRQKELAEQRQRQAEQAKRVADTLAYLTLGRSLGTTAATLFRTGNPETAGLLAYASWTFIKRYGGDRFTPSVFNALTLVSGQPRVWQRHKGGIGAVVWKGAGAFYSLGRYGEVMEWTAGTDGDYDTRTLTADPSLDFRDGCLDSGRLYALSYGGELLAFSDGEARQSRLPVKGKCLRILPAGRTLRVLTADGSLQDMQGGTCLPCEGVTCAAAFGDRLLAGTADGGMVEADGDSVRLIGNNHPAAVTAIAYDSTSGTTAWGYADGTAILAGRDGKQLKRLVGHRSAITGMAFAGGRLCTCSHDRTLRLWNILEERTESVTALEAASWLLCMALSPDGKTLLAGDSDGRIYSLSLFPEDMAEILRESFRRELTHQEWDYYIGKEIPYETYMDINR